MTRRIRETCGRPQEDENRFSEHPVRMRAAIVMGVGLQLLLGCAEGEQLDPQLFSSEHAGSPTVVPMQISAAGASGQAGSISFGGAAGGGATPTSLGGGGAGGRAAP